MAPPRWLHRLALLTAAATLLLILVGGLVTSTASGMAFPDWPTSAGKSMVAYPWFRATGKAFVEHGHRLAGMTVGILTLATAFGIWFTDSRRWVKVLGLAASAAVLLQGILGGMRVLHNSHALAFLHACLAQAFFALNCILATVLASSWGEVQPVPGRAALRTLCAVTALAIYLQAVLGASVRQLGRPATLHVTMAALVALLAFLSTSVVLRDHLDVPALSRPALWLSGLVLFQASLGLATWISVRTSPSPRASLDPVLHSTLHVATGALLLGTAASLALKVRRWTC